CPLLTGRSLTVVTASLAVVRSLATAPNIDIVILGGLLRPNYDSMVGTLTETALSQLRVDLAFLGTAGIRADGAVLDSTPSEVPIKRGLLDVATSSYLLADHEKFPGSGFLEVAPLSRFSGVITDRSPLPFDIALPDGEDVEVLLPCSSPSWEAEGSASPWPARRWPPASPDSPSTRSPCTTSTPRGCAPSPR